MRGTSTPFCGVHTLCSQTRGRGWKSIGRVAAGTMVSLSAAGCLVLMCSWQWDFGCCRGMFLSGSLDLCLLLARRWLGLCSPALTVLFQAVPESCLSPLSHSC